LGSFLSLDGSKSKLPFIDAHKKALKMNYLKGAALVAALSSNCQGFNLLAPRTSQVISLTGSHRRGFTPYPIQNTNHVSKLYSAVAGEKDSAEKTSVPFDPADAFTGEAPSKILGGKIPYSELTIGVLKETYPGENRVSVAPESAKMLVDAGFSVIVESGGEFTYLLTYFIQL
jgi:hypothetical protein